MMASTYRTIQMRASTTTHTNAGIYPHTHTNDVIYIHNHVNDGIYTHTQPYK